MKGEAVQRPPLFQYREKKPFPGGDTVLDWGQKSAKELTL